MKDKNKRVGSKKNTNSEGIERIEEKPETLGPVSPYIETKLYTIDDMIDVWCRGATNGATLWQYCQDNNKTLPSSFEAGLLELVNELRSAENKAVALQQFLNNNMILLGVFDEKTLTGLSQIVKFLGNKPI